MRSITGTLRKLKQRIIALRGDVRGNVLVVVAIGTTSLVGAAGIGVDTVQWYLWKRQLQQAVDSGAMAGALSLYTGHSYDQPSRDEVARNYSATYASTRSSPGILAFNSFLMSDLFASLSPAPGVLYQTNVSAPPASLLVL